jgi:hypothetical protein
VSSFFSYSCLFNLECDLHLLLFLRWQGKPLQPLDNGGGTERGNRAELRWQRAALRPGEGLWRGRLRRLSQARRCALEGWRTKAGWSVAMGWNAMAKRSAMAERSAMADTATRQRDAWRRGLRFPSAAARTRRTAARLGLTRLASGRACWASAAWRGRPRRRGLGSTRPASGRACRAAAVLRGRPRRLQWRCPRHEPAERSTVSAGGRRRRGKRRLSEPWERRPVRGGGARR